LPQFLVVAANAVLSRRDFVADRGSEQCVMDLCRSTIAPRSRQYESLMKKANLKGYGGGIIALKSMVRGAGDGFVHR
jgi:hypothetical protein